MRIPRPKTFYLHFNRIAMRDGDPKVWSVRLSDRCLHATQVKVDVPLETVYKPKQKNNPRAFFKGVGYGYWVETKSGEEYLWITNQLYPDVDRTRSRA